MAESRKELLISDAVVDGRLPWSVPQLLRRDARDAESGINIFTEANTGNS